MSEERNIYTSFHDLSPREYMYIPKGTLEIGKPGEFSRIEITHLLISMGVLTVAFALSFTGNNIITGLSNGFNPNVLPYGLLVSFLGILTAFFVHEMSHKFMAQRLGYWAEFRLNPMGLFITLLSFMSPFKLIAPGAVMIGGPLIGDDYGKISIVGPLTNIVQAIFYLLIGILIPGSYARIFSYVGVTVNSSLALFNLIPFGVFDGVKIMRWNMKIWLATTGLALALYFYSSL